LVAHMNPVLQVVTSVVADEWQHGHWIVAQGADLSFSGSCGLAGCQQGTDHGAVLPVKGLGYQWNSACATAAEQNGVELHALPVIKFRCSGWALGNWGAVARVRVSRRSSGVWIPVLTGPVDEVLWSVPIHALPPDVAIIRSCNVGENGVAWLHGLHRNRVRSIVGTRSNAEETIFWVHSVKTVFAQVQPRDVVTNDLSGPTFKGWGNHGQVGLATSGWESTSDVVGLALR